MSMVLTPTSLWGIVALLGVVIAVLLVPVEGRRAEKSARGRRRRPTPAQNQGERSGPMKVTDPVCGMTFEETKAVATVEHRGRTYYFCAQACRKQFEADPDRYAAAGP